MVQVFIHLFFRKLIENIKLYKKSEHIQTDEDCFLDQVEEVDQKVKEITRKYRYLSPLKLYKKDCEECFIQCNEISLGPIHELLLVLDNFLDILNHISEYDFLKEEYAKNIRQYVIDMKIIVNYIQVLISYFVYYNSSYQNVNNIIYDFWQGLEELDLCTKEVIWLNIISSKIKEKNDSKTQENQQKFLYFINELNIVIKKDVSVRKQMIYKLNEFINSIESRKILDKKI